MKFEQQQVLSSLNRMLMPTVGSAGDLEACLQRIVRTAAELFTPDVCAILALNPLTGQRVIRLTDAAGQQTSQRFGSETLPPDGVTARVLHDQLIFASDLDGQPDLRSRHTASNGFRAYAAAALSAGPARGQLAVLFLNYRQPQMFHDETRALLKTVAESAAETLYQTWLLQRYSAITEVGAQINQDLEQVPQLFARLQRLSAPVINTRYRFILAAYEPQTGQLEVHSATHGLPDPPQPAVAPTPWQQTLLSTREPLFETGDSQAPIAERTAWRIAVPLVLRDVPLGLLAVESQQMAAYSNDDLQILQLLGNQVALALSNIRLFHNLEQLNQAGQALTQRLDSEAGLQLMVDRIRSVAHADLVALYPFDQHTDMFVLPPPTSGEFRAEARVVQIDSRDDHTAFLVLRADKPVHAKDSTTLYAKVGGDTIRHQGRFVEREGVRSTSALPLRVGEKVVGVLFVNFRQPQRFDAPQRQLIESLANYAAIGIANSRSFIEQQRRHVRQLETLQEVDRALARSLDVQETLQKILDLTMAHIDPDRASIFLYDSRTALLEAKAARPPDRLHRTQSVHEQRGLVGWAFVNRQSVRVSDVLHDPEWKDRYLQASEDTRAELDVPMRDGDDIVGVINFESRTINAFSAADQQFLEVLAGQAVLALKRAQDYGELEALFEISSEIIGQLDTHQVFNLILHKALDLTNSPAGTLMLYDAEHDTVVMAAERGVSAAKKNQGHSAGDGVVGQCVRDCRLINVADVTEAPWDKIHLDYIPGVRSELAVPLLEGERLHGVINLESTLLNHFSRRHERLVTALAVLAVVAIQNADRYQQAQQRRQQAEERQEQLRALYAVDREIIAAAESFDRVIEVILQHALRLGRAEIGDLHLYEGGVVTRAHFASADTIGGTPHITVSDDLTAPAMQLGIVQRVAQTRQPYLTNQAQQDRYYVGASDILSEVAVPLISRENQLIGVLNLESRRANAFDSSEVELLELLAGAAVIAIQSARSYMRLRLLDDIGRKLGGIADVDEIDNAYQIVRAFALQLYPAAQVTVRRYDDRAGGLRLVCAVDGHPIVPNPVFKAGEGPQWQVYEHRQTILVPDRNHPPAGIHVDALPPEARSWLGTPLMFGNQYYGTLAITLVTPNQVLEVDQRLFEGMAQQLSITIHRIEVVKERSEAERRSKEDEAMSIIGQGAFSLTHRIGSDLSLVRILAKRTRGELERNGNEYLPLIERLGRIEEIAGSLGGLNVELKNNLVQLRQSDGRPERFQVHDLLGDVLGQYKRMLDTVTIMLDLPAKIRPLYANYRQIFDTLLNLLTNAVQAMPAGTLGTIVLRAYDDDDFVVIEVEDNGPGIAEEEQGLIFTLFYSTKASSGFGLWNARKYAAANGGSLTVRSQPGQGTTFRLALPHAGA